MGWTHTRALIAATRRHDPHADVTDLQRRLRAERLANTITTTLNRTPPLTTDQRRGLAALLLAGLPDGGGQG
jgi:hypothetical protein